jgi:7-cyano-7-deazaguanine synthase
MRTHRAKLFMATPKDTKKRAVVLLSGGLDSATVAAWLLADGFEVYALTIDYGQRHVVELKAADIVARELGVKEHLILPIDLGSIGASALTDLSMEVPKAQRVDEPVKADIPVTYVPARNTVFLSLALSFAEARGADVLGIGVNALDYSGYPDCRPEFISAFEELANLATQAGVEGRKFRLFTPLQHLSKVSILLKAHDLGVPVDQTISCYDPSADGTACGLCDSCRLRWQAEKEVGNGV